MAELNSTTAFGSLRIDGTLLDSSGDAGTSGQILSSTVTGTNWITSGGADNSISEYAQYIGTGTDEDVTGTLYERSELGTGGTKVLFK